MREKEERENKGIEGREVNVCSRRREGKGRERERTSRDEKEFINSVSLLLSSHEYS